MTAKHSLDIDTLPGLMVRSFGIYKVCVTIGSADSFISKHVQIDVGEAKAASLREESTLYIESYWP